MIGVEREQEEETLVDATVRILNTAEPFEKAQLGNSTAFKWLQGLITCPYHPSQNLPLPDRPARLTNVSSIFSHFLFPINYHLHCFNENSFFFFLFKLVSPGLMPKLGKAGSLQSRQAIVHSLVHTESWAIDLFWVLYISFFCFLIVFITVTMASLVLMYLGYIWYKRLNKIGLL